jgi:hypothetical protein
MSPPRRQKTHGQIRRSQLITTFGPGALVDLPKYSVLVSGLEGWSPNGREEIHEPRLVEKLRLVLGSNDLRLYSPPIDTDAPGLSPTGITAWQFPEWFITQDWVDCGQGPDVRSRMLVHRMALDRGKVEDSNRKKHSVVPVRFVRACRKGHIGDIDWFSFVHSPAKNCKRQLWIDEHGTSGDLAEVWIRCECGDRRAMSQAARIELRALGNCQGDRPWLGPFSKESCGEPNRLLVRTASNAYFPQTMSVISLPDRNETMVKAVTMVWETYLQFVMSLEDLQSDRKKKPPVEAALKGFTDEEVFAEIQARRGVGAPVSAKTVKQAEIETLLTSQEEIGNDRPEGVFFARALPKAVWDAPWMQTVERVVLVHRLREVIAQASFTRFEAISPDTEGELEMGVQRAALALDLSWLPAIENKGEGIFVSFGKDALEHWLETTEVKSRARELENGFKAWQEEHRGTHRQFPGLPYIMLHSLSHLLLTSLALECGYPASSLRERVYAGEGGYGILIYTGSPDSEGTMGGLVATGRRISYHMKAALEMARLCSNDPVCAQHEPRNAHEKRFLLGAACHGCLLIAETSCEQHNDFLDRALVVPTVAGLAAEFFKSLP